MARGRKSDQNKKKKRKSVNVVNSNNTSVRETRHRKCKSEEFSNNSTTNIQAADQSSSSTNSQTSPFKGFVDNSPNCSQNLFSQELELSKKQKNDAFDNLFSQDSAVNLHHNIRTYTNKNKVKHPENESTESDQLISDNCRNRDDIIRWLNDTENVFGRLTQTQNVLMISEDIDIPPTAEMPSVSQVCNSKNNNRVCKRRIRPSPYKTRARSLDIQIKKNAKSGRNKRHSLSSDALALDNYKIDDAVTDEDVLIPADTEAKLLIDLMEDEYLQNIENEMLQRDEKKNQSFTGWDRIKDMNKTINANKKQPKQLKVLVHAGDNKNDKLPAYDYNLLEEFFCNNMSKLIETENNGFCGSEEGSALSNQCDLVNQGLKLGKGFVVVLKKLIEIDKKSIKQFQTLFSDLKMIFRNSDTHVSCQTFVPLKFHQNVQTQRNISNKCIQTEINLADKEIQTKVKLEQREVQTTLNEFEHKEVQTSAELREHKNVQTDMNKNNIELQTEGRDSLKVVSCKPAEKSSTASIEDTNGKLNDIETESSRKSEPENIKSDLDGDEFDDIDFDTEDILVHCKIESILDESDKKVLSSGAPASSVLMITNESSKGVKRPSSDSQTPNLQPRKYKRPCEKFIDNDLSVNFSTSFEEEETAEVKQKPASDEFENNDYVAYILKKDAQAGTTEVSSKRRTQEQIEELENLIYNANKRSVNTDKNLIQPEETSENFQDDSDYFKPCDSSTSTIRSRKRLFPPENDNKFSESMFSGDTNENKTHTDKDSHGNKESAEINKSRINILENIVIKPADNIDHLDDILSDVDIVESTPPKKYTSSEQRAQSVLNITLPPPFEFQDSQKLLSEERDVKMNVPNNNSTPRRPLITLNKVTSTPLTQRGESEDILSLSPINGHQKVVSAKDQENSFSKNKIAGPIELAQKSKFLPLTIIKKPKSQNSFRSSGTPKQKSILNYVQSTPEHVSQKSQSSDVLSPNTKPCISCTRLNKNDVMSICLLTNKNLASYSSTYCSKVTHMIVSTDQNNYITGHTIKVVQAIAAGIWVLNFGWVQECLKKNRLVSEEPYEVLDITGVPGPRKSRLTRTVKPLLGRFRIHAAPPFETTTRSAIENVIEMLGGKIVKDVEDLLDRKGYICIILTEAKATQDFEIYEAWLNGLRTITVDVEWLCRSVAQYEVLSFRPFVLCSEENIDCLGYPPELMENVSLFSSSPPSVVTVTSI